MTDLDGDGWVRCDLGHRHWGRFGAAGLLGFARDGVGQTHVLLQHRSLWSSHGGTWGLFGGARQRDEPAVAAALREAAEECTLPVDMPRIRGVLRDDHGGWAYDTVVGELPRPVPVEPVSAETAAAAWVLADDVTQLELHPGLAAFWLTLRGALEPFVIIVDAANVVGSRADGWWRDRAGAAARLRDEISSFAARGLRSVPAGVTAPPLDVWYPEIIFVVEGAARAVAATPAGTAVDKSGGGAGAGCAGGGAAVGRAGTGQAGTGRLDARAGGVSGVAAGPGPGADGSPHVAPVTGSVRVAAARGSGDDMIAELAAETRGIRLVVTADRELRRRCEAVGAAVTGPRWLLNLL
jgi:8-oxo-dGTP diphosphatase